jgi:hypothetical protein
LIYLLETTVAGAEYCLGGGVGEGESLGEEEALTLALTLTHTQTHSPTHPDKHHLAVEIFLSEKMLTQLSCLTNRKTFQI